VPLVADTSAWARQRDPALIDRWKATLIAGLIARNEEDFALLDRAPAALPQAASHRHGLRQPRSLRHASCAVVAACRPPTI
jgi:hypothetical protein